MKHRFGDVQSVTHGQGSIGPGFVQEGASGDAGASLVKQTIAAILQKAATPLGALSSLPG